MILPSLSAYFPWCISRSSAPSSGSATHTELSDSDVDMAEASLPEEKPFYPTSFDPYVFFLQMQEKLDNDKDEIIPNEEIANQIFIEQQKNLEYLHQTPLRHFNQLFLEFCIDDAVEEDVHRRILSVFSEIFTVSLMNSSFHRATIALDRSIDQDLFLTEFIHFQSVIQRGKKALKSTAIQNIQSAAIEVDQLFNLYTYTEGEEGLLFEYLIDHAYIDRAPQFPNAKRLYPQFKTALKNRKVDSPLFKLKGRLHMRISQILQSSSQYPHRFQSDRDVFCDVEAEAIWRAGMKILRTAYVMSFPSRASLSDEALYQEWHEYARESALDSGEILKKFISGLEDDDFNSFAKYVQSLHANEDSEELKDVRAKIIFRRFRFDFRFTVEPERPLDLANLKKWCAT